VPDDPTTHRQYNFMKHRNPVASLDIPNSFYYKWDTKIDLLRKLGRPVPSYADLLNFSLSQSSLFGMVSGAIEGRLKSLGSAIRNAYTSLPGGKAKSDFKLKSRKMLLCKDEVEEQCTIEIPGT